MQEPKWSINEFCEPLDHEFGNDIEPLPSQNRGVRIDEDWGLKQYCEHQQLKSVDFLMRTKSGYCFLEFSDIGRQIDQTLQKISEVRASENMSRALKKNITNGLRRSVSQEARNKYTDTCLIFSHAADHLCDSPELSKGCKFLIVYAPFSDHIQNSKEDLFKFLDYMKDSLTTAIPDAMFHKVEIITLDIFRKKYCQ